MQPLALVLAPLVVFCATGAYFVAALSLGHYSWAAVSLAGAVGLTALPLSPDIARAVMRAR